MGTRLSLIKMNPYVQNPAGYDEESSHGGDSGPHTCRLCLETGPLPLPNGELIAPCSCMGSVKYVHRSCLDQWRSVSPRMDSFYKCDLCQTSYVFDMKEEGEGGASKCRFYSLVARDCFAVFLALNLVVIPLRGSSSPRTRLSTGFRLLAGCRSTGTSTWLTLLSSTFAAGCLCSSTWGSWGSVMPCTRAACGVSTLKTRARKQRSTNAPDRTLTGGPAPASAATGATGSTAPTDRIRGHTHATRTLGDATAVSTSASAVLPPRTGAPGLPRQIAETQTARPGRPPRTTALRSWSLRL